MTERPRLLPQILAEIAESAPDRLRRKLDKNPTVANEWDWSVEGECWIIDAGSEQVRLQTSDATILAAEHVSCSCLLSPRCFHVLSVLSVLELSEALVEEAPESETDNEPIETEAPAELTEDQFIAARSMWSAAAGILAVGARAAGTLLQSQLLRDS